MAKYRITVTRSSSPWTKIIGAILFFGGIAIAMDYEGKDLQILGWIMIFLGMGALGI